MQNLQAGSLQLTPARSERPVLTGLIVLSWCWAQGTCLHKQMLTNSASPFLSVAQSFPCEVICIVHNLQLPAENGDDSTDVQHVWLNRVISTPLQKGLAVLDVILQANLYCIKLFSNLPMSRQ